jgi:hypothetical protein
MEEDKTYTYTGSITNDPILAANLANSINGHYTITANNPYITTGIDEDWLKEKIDDLQRKSLKDIELPEDKTSVDLAKLTSEVIIKFLRSPEGISLLANELDKYFKK